MCQRCKRDKQDVKSFPAANNMDPGEVPSPLQGLTQVKEIMMARGCPIMRVYRLTGGQGVNDGHVVNLVQGVGGSSVAY